MKGNSGAVSIDERVTSRNGVALNLVELPPEGVYVRLRRAFMSACVIFVLSALSEILIQPIFWRRR
mgnify:CR=1 FL=1